MREKFKVTGLFYEVNGYKFRKFLNIRKDNSESKIPDLIVVMMNPGSSRPINGIENDTIETDAIPDNTQKQIMRVMENCGFHYTRILNLSDLREPKSSVFYTKIDELDQKNIPHSIFDEKRKNDFETLFVKNVPVIFAWGVNKNLKILAQKAIKRITTNNSIGLKKNGVDFAYYHPLPQIYQKQKEWVENITECIITSNSPK
jgi:hypothetical protein